LDTLNPNPFLPLSARTIYRHYTNVLADDVAATGTEAADPFYNILLVEGVNLLTPAAGTPDLQVWLQAWNDPICTAPQLGTPSCSSNLIDPLEPFSATTSEAFPKCTLQVARTSLTGNYNNAPNTNNKVAFLLPVNRLALHASQSAWICVSAQNPFTPTNAADIEINTNLLYQVAPRCFADSPTGVRDANYDVLPEGPNLQAALDSPDPFPHACSVLAGIDEVDNTLTADFFVNAVTQFGEEPVTVIINGETFTPSNELEYFERRSRTQCCGWRPSGLVDDEGNTLPARWGVCINPKIESCCSSRTDARGSTLNNIGGTGKPYNPFTEKCCYGGDVPNSATLQLSIRTAGDPVAIADLDDNCPCDPARARTFCGASQQCCSFTKFPELVINSTVVSLTGPLATTVTGKCYDPREQNCCDTGEVFNPAVAKCCRVNGLTDADLPCPCNLDSDCGNGQNDFCCRQTAPVVAEMGTCSPYLNYPTGSGAAHLQRCTGKCIDTRYQICCNGAACLDEYESCCNTTCCNRFTSDCKMGYRSGAPGSRFSSNEYNVPYEICTSIEAVTPYRATFAYILPAGLLFAMFLGLAFTLFFAKRVNSLNPISAYERAILALSLFAIVLSWPLFFSPMYKYGVVFIWVAFFTIVAALAGLKRLVVVALVFQVVVLIYIFDPFGGNEILNLAYHRVDRLNGFGYTGVFLSVRNLWNDTAATGGSDFPGWRCVDFYDGYFNRDAATEDRARIHDPLRSTYGYCGREWISVLLYLTGVITVTYIVLFVVTLITHAKNVLVKKVISQNPLHY